MPHTGRTPEFHGRKGNYAITFLVALTPLLGFAALTIDIGYQHLSRAQLSASIDAAALAAASQLDETESGVESARTSAQQIAALNPAGGYTVSLDENATNASDGDIVFGTWDGDNFTATSDPESINAVSVSSSVTLSAMFSMIAFDRLNLGVNARTVAFSPTPVAAGTVECILPFALPDCLFENYTAEQLQTMEFVFNPAGVDNVGWVRPDDRPSDASVMDLLNDCESLGPLSVGDPVGLGNGVLGNTYREIAQQMANSSTSWNTELWGTQAAQQRDSLVSATAWGKTFEGPIVVFDGGPEYCSSGGGAWNEILPAVGFVWGAVFDVRQGQGAANKNVYVRVDATTERELGTSEGELSAGILYQPPAQIAL